MAVGTSYRVKPGRMLREGWQARSERLRGFSWTGRHGVLLVALLGALIRFWQIGSLGFNSDEAVYAGQAASLAGDPRTYLPLFPVFRAHPLLFQSLLSVIYRRQRERRRGPAARRRLRRGHRSWSLPARPAALRPTGGLVAALLLAAMPYHVGVSRQVLLDGPMVFFATFAVAARPVLRRAAAVWLVAAAAVWGWPSSPRRRPSSSSRGVDAFCVLTHVVKVRASLVAWSLAAWRRSPLAFPLASRSRARVHRAAATWRGSCSAGRTTRSTST